MIRISTAGETVTLGEEPSALTTGYERFYRQEQLTPYTGPAAITIPGTIIEGKIIDVNLSIQAANVTIKKCLVRGAAATSIKGLIDCRFATTKNFLLEDCIAYARVPSSFINGAVIGHDFTVRRCNISQVVDGIGIYNTTGPNANAVVEDSWIHDLTYYAPDVASNRTDTHNDCIQVQGGKNFTIRNNRLDGFMSLTQGQQTFDQRARGNCILIQSNVAAYPASDYSVASNWFHGGGNAAQLTLRAGNGAVSYNTFDKTGYMFTTAAPQSRYQIRYDKVLEPTLKDITTNTWTNGTSLSYGRDLGIRTD